MKQKLLEMYFEFFGFLARRYIQKHSPYIIGITGSIGKTSARMILYDILRQNFPEKKISTSSKNFNGELGLSFSILGISNYTPSLLGVIKVVFRGVWISFFGEKNSDILLLEYGIDHVGEMDFLLSIARPNIAVLTKIDSVHSLQFQSKDIIAQEKYKLLENALDYAFFNRDDDFFEKYFGKENSKHYQYQTNNNNTQLSFQKDKNKILSQFVYVFGEKNIEISSPLLGKENIGYIDIGLQISEILSKKYYQKSLLEAKQKMFFDFQLQPSRFSLLKGISNSIIIDSTYNAAPASMKQVIENFLNLQQNIYREYEIILCLGEMRELGEYTSQAHKDLAIFTKNITPNIFVVGESMKQYFLGENYQAKWYKNSKILGEDLKKMLEKNSDKKYIILCKGSQNTIFLEETVKNILQNPRDISKLCRQEDFWMEKKNIFFKK